MDLPSAEPGRPVVHDASRGPCALVVGFEFEQEAFRGTSFYARTLLRALHELGLETRLLTGAAADSNALLERLLVARQLIEPTALPKRRRRLSFLRDCVWPSRPRLVALGVAPDLLDRLGYSVWVDRFVNRPGVYDFVRMRSRRLHSAYPVPRGHADIVLAPAPINVRPPPGVPLIQAFHDLSPLVRVDHPPQDDAREFLSRVRGMERYADAVLCCSEAARGELVTHFPSLAARCEVLHPPVSLFAEEVALAQEPEIERGILGRYGVQPNGYLLHVGVIERKKNVQRLVDAYNAVRPQLGIPLLLAGWLGYGSHEIAPALERGGEWLRHLGYVSQLDKIVLLRNARALVFPSMYEGFGLPPIEAMLLGCPVLASNIPAVAEACGSAAHLVDCRSMSLLSEGLVDIAGDANLRSDLRVRGFRRAEELSLSRYRWRLGEVLSRFVSVPETAAAVPVVRKQEPNRDTIRGHGVSDIAPVTER